jgi:xylan 1,4-beta-xylosidase
LQDTWDAFASLASLASFAGFVPYIVDSSFVRWPLAAPRDNIPRMVRLVRLLMVPLAAVMALMAATDPAQVPRPEPAPKAGVATSYQNPVLPGDYPDPSVIRVGSEYWATATTSQWAPIFPLLHSTDLVNWRLVGSVFQTPPAWSAGSYWAPEIAEDRGRFFVYYTARKKDGPLCVAVADAAKPEGPYTDRGPLVCQDVGSIDAAAVRDENGRRYLVWKEDGNSRKLPTPLWAQPLSEDGTKLTGQRQEILRNEAAWEAHLIEGPFILRRGEWFYMFYSADACCGRRCNYKLGVARARKLLGPWERHPGNPILAANEHWKCPGHGSIVTDPTNRTFLLYHAYHPTDFEYVGRQGLLDEMTWDAQGWPAINGGQGPSQSAASPLGKAQSRMTAPVDDDFARGPLDPAWQWPWDQPEQPKVDPSRDGWLRLVTGSVDSAPKVAIAARPTIASSYTATTMVEVSSIASGARAGLAAFGNRDNMLAVSVERPQAPGGSPATDALTIVVWQTQKGQAKTLASERLDARDRVYLQLKATDRTRFAFAVSPDGQQWRTVAAQADGGYLPPWDLSVRVALLVAGPPNASARFGAFNLAQGDR